MASTFHLIIAIPEQEPVCYAIQDEVVTIGRSPENSIQVLVREVSTKHCELVGDEEGYEIVDLGSSNGTRVKGQGIRNGRVFLNHHDKIILGETVPAYFVVSEEGERFSVRKTISEVERIEAEKVAAATQEEVPAENVAPAPVAATQATSAQSGASTQVLKKKLTLPPMKSGGAANPPARKVPSLTKPKQDGDKPKFPPLARPGSTPSVASAEAEPEPEPAAEVKKELPKVPALKKPAKVEVVEDEPAAEEVEEAVAAAALPAGKPAVPLLKKPGAAPLAGGGGRSAVPVLSKPALAKKVPNLSKPGAAPKLATPEANPAAKKVPKLNLPKKGD